MFKGEKTFVFWIGLIVLALASIALFSIIWYNMVTVMRTYPYSPALAIEYQVPFILAAIVFILIGLYMMKSGVRTESRIRTSVTQS